MKLRKNMLIHFLKRNEIEVIQKASNDPYSGEIITNNQTYSTDFIYRWIDFGFVKILNKKGEEIK